MNPNEVPLIAVYCLQLTTHPGHSSQDINQWSATNAKHFKWLSFSKVLVNPTLDSNNPVAIGRMYSTLQLHIKLCHEDDISIVPYLSTLKPSDTFSVKMLHLTSYNSYHEALVFFKKLANHLHFLFEDPNFAAKAPIAHQGLRFIQSS